MGKYAVTATRFDHSYEDDAWVIPLERKTQATKAVNDELQAPKAYGFTQDESNASLVATVGNDDEFW
jgi:hypothetical protein